MSAKKPTGGEIKAELLEKARLTAYQAGIYTGPEKELYLWEQKERPKPGSMSFLTPRKGDFVGYRDDAGEPLHLYLVSPERPPFGTEEEWAELLERSKANGLDKNNVELWLTPKKQVDWYLVNRLLELGMPPSYAQSSAKALKEAYEIFRVGMPESGNERASHDQVIDALFCIMRAGDMRGIGVFSGARSFSRLSNTWRSPAEIFCEWVQRRKSRANAKGGHARRRQQRADDQRYGEEFGPPQN